MQESSCRSSGRMGRASPRSSTSSPASSGRPRAPSPSKIATSGLGPARLARLGIARSFQLVQIFPDLTVLETLQAAVVSRLGRGTRLFASLAADREVQEGAIDVAELFGLGEKRHVPAKQLDRKSTRLNSS